MTDRSPQPAAVSVVIPARNAAETIGAAVASAFAQSTPPATIQVIDDSSSDRTVEAALAAGAEVRANQGKGSNAARQTGLGLASTEWILFLDADDELLPGHLANLLDVVTHEGSPRIDAVFSPSIICQGNELPEAHPAPDLTLPVQDPSLAFLTNQGFQTGAVLWRRSSLLGIGGWDENIPCCQDYEVASRAIRAGLRITGTRRPGAVYRLHSAGTLSRRDPLAVLRRSVDLLADFRRWQRSSGREDARYAQAGRSRLFSLLWEAAGIDPDWAHRNYRRLQAEDLVGPRLTGTRAERLVKLVGWERAVRWRKKRAADR